MASAKKHMKARDDDGQTPYGDFWMLESEFDENFRNTEYNVIQTPSGESKWLSVYLGYNQVQKVIAKLFFFNVILQVNFFSNTSDDTYKSFGEELKKKKISQFEKTTFTDKHEQTHRAYEIKTDLKNWISVYKIVFQLIKSMASPKSDHFTERVQFPVPREEETSVFDFKEVFVNAPLVSKSIDKAFLPASFASVTASIVQDEASAPTPDVQASGLALAPALVVQAPALPINEVEDITNLVENLNVSDDIVTAPEVQNTVQISEQKEAFGVSFIQYQQNLLISNAFAFMAEFVNFPERTKALPHHMRQMVKEFKIINFAIQQAQAHED